MFKELGLDDLIISKQNVRRNVQEEVESETTIDSLAHDIKKNGLIHPLCVRPTKDGKYEVYAGSRRLLALKKLKVNSVLCRIEEISDNDAFIVSLSENLQRKKMLQKEKLEIFSKLFSVIGNVEEVAKTVSYSPHTVKDYLTLKDFLEPKLYSALDAKGDNKLSMELALFLSKNVPKEDQVKIYEQIIQLGTTELKKQTITNYNTMNKEDEEEEEDLEQENEAKPEKEPKEKPVKIPKEPWIFDEEQNPLIIPKEVYIDVLQVVRKYT